MNLADVNITTLKISPVFRLVSLHQSEDDLFSVNYYFLFLLCVEVNFEEQAEVEG